MVAVSVGLEGTWGRPQRRQQYAAITGSIAFLSNQEGIIKEKKKGEPGECGVSVPQK